MNDNHHTERLAATARAMILVWSVFTLLISGIPLALIVYVMYHVMKS